MDQTQSLIHANFFTIFLAIGYTILTIIIGIYANKKSKTAEQFFGGTKSFGAWTIAFASSAAVMSAFGFIGGPGLVYQSGFSSIWITIAAGTGFVYAYWVLGKRVRAMAEVANIATLPDIAHIRFQSNWIRGLLAIGLFIASIAYLSSQVKGGTYLFEQMLGVSQPVAVAILFGAILLYMLISGMAASILTDAFQAAVMAIGVIGTVIGYFLLTHNHAMPVIQHSQAFGKTFTDAAGTAPLSNLLVFFLIFFIGTMGQPQMLAKMYTLKSYKDLKIAGIFSGIAYTVTSLVWILVGYGALYIVASGKHAPLTTPDNAAFLFLSQMNVVIQGIIMAALLAAIKSTSSFFVSMGSSAITRDLIGALGHEISHKHQIFWGRILTVFIVLFSIFFGFTGGDMVAILGTLGWGFFASVTLPTFTIGLLWKGASKEGVITGLVVAILLNVILLILKRFHIYQLPFPDYFLAIAAAMVVTVLVSLFTSGAAGKNLSKEMRLLFDL